VQGVDVWLNNPRRPYEACGTSGMKAAVNGVLNLSILDGWWCEGYTPETGWAIGHGEEFTDPDYQDAVESQALYNVLENDVIPCFYDRRNGNAPAFWLEKMKASMKMALRDFNSHRMVAEYRHRFYDTAAHSLDSLVADEASEARNLAEQYRRLDTLWNQVRIEAPERNDRGVSRVGDTFSVTTTVELGELHPGEVEVQAYYGPLKSVDALESSHVQPMEVTEDLGQGRYRYGCTLACRHSGRFGFTARVIPRGDDRLKNMPKLLTWA